MDKSEQHGKEPGRTDGAAAWRLAVWIGSSVTSDVVEMVPTGRRADSL
jgi:hypothetical protein